MQYELSFINPTTGEQETRELKEDNCWNTINNVYSITIPEKKIKPVNIKLELKLDLGE